MSLYLVVIFVLASELGSADFPENASTRIAQNQRVRLREALDKGNVEAIQALIEEGVDLVTPFGDSETALHATCAKRNKKALKLILDKGVPLEARNRLGETAFHISVQFGYIGIAATLLEAGAEINTPDVNGCTPLSYKVYKNRLGTVEWLLRNGASLYAVENNGRSPFDWALYFEWTKIVRILIEYGADISPPKYDPMEIFEEYWETCFKLSQNNSDNFDKYVAFITNAFLTEVSDDERSRDDPLFIYSVNHVFALYRILKATYPKERMRRIPSRLESAKVALFDIFAARITEKTYLGAVPLDVSSDVLFLSERIFWRIESLSFYLALISVNYNYTDVSKAFTREEIMHFIKYYML